jgi:hypothetical protein
MLSPGFMLIALFWGLMFGLSKFRSRSRTPKEKRGKFNWRKPIARKAHLKTCSNPLKPYRIVPRWKLERWAREKRATQVDENGMPVWPAEIEFHGILRRLTHDIRIQEPFYTPATFILRDFYAPGLKLVFEIDGSTHSQQISYDAECDKWLAGMGIRTVRIHNRTVPASPHVAEQVARQALGL